MPSTIPARPLPKPVSIFSLLLLAALALALAFWGGTYAVWGAASGYGLLLLAGLGLLAAAGLAAFGVWKVWRYMGAN